MTNCIFWGNRTDPMHMPADLETEQVFGDSCPDHCIIEDFPGDCIGFSGGTACTNDCDGNSAEDPVFVMSATAVCSTFDPTNPGSCPQPFEDLFTTTDYSVLTCSPAVEGGGDGLPCAPGAIPCDELDVNRDGIMDEPTPDLALNPRVVDNPDSDSEAIVDMGAYELIPPSCPWDCGDGDGTVGTRDMLDLLAQWNGTCGDPSVTCDLLPGPGVGTPEFLALLAGWGPCTPNDPDPPTLEEDLEDACLTQDDWDKHVDTMTDDDFTQEEKDNSDCWMRHYIFDCNRCQCPQTGHSGCPGPDPFGG